MEESGRRMGWGEVRASRVRILLAAALAMAERGETNRALRVFWRATQFMPCGNADALDQFDGLRHR